MPWVGKSQGTTYSSLLLGIQLQWLRQTAATKASDTDPGVVTKFSVFCLPLLLLVCARGNMAGIEAINQSLEDTRGSLRAAKAKLEATSRELEKAEQEGSGEIEVLREKVAKEEAEMKKLKSKLRSLHVALSSVASALAQQVQWQTWNATEAPAGLSAGDGAAVPSSHARPPPVVVDDVERGGETPRARTRLRSRARSVSRSRSGHRSDMAQAAKMMLKAAKTQKKRARGRSASSSSDSDADGNEHLFSRMQSKYQMHGLEIVDVPKDKKIRQIVKDAEKALKKGKPPFVNEPISSKFLSIRNEDASWAKDLDKHDVLTWAQYSALWWGRSYLQLLAQVAVKWETFSVGELHARFSVLTNLACSEGIAVAAKYDAETWKEVGAKIQAGGGVGCVGPLLSIDENKLAEVKRLRTKPVDKKPGGEKGSETERHGNREGDKFGKDLCGRPWRDSDRGNKGHGKGDEKGWQYVDKRNERGRGRPDERGRDGAGRRQGLLHRERR